MNNIQASEGKYPTAPNPDATSVPVGGYTVKWFKCLCLSPL